MPSRIGWRSSETYAVVDDFTRECLGLIADTSLSGLRLGRELDGIVERRGCRPEMIVSDNGTELTSHAILRWQEQHGVLWHYIAPGKPQHPCQLGGERDNHFVHVRPSRQVSQPPARRRLLGPQRRELFLPRSIPRTAISILRPPFLRLGSLGRLAGGPAIP